MGDSKEIERSSILCKFREKVSDVTQSHHDDEYLLRWLRARNFDIPKSEEMLRNHLEWRQRVGADSILDWTPPEVIRRYFPGGIVGFGKAGHPVWIEPVGPTDLRGLMMSVKRKDLIRYKIYHCELIQKVMREQTAQMGKYCDGLVIIFDTEGLGMKHLWKPSLSFYSEVLTIFEAHYPETLHKTYVINAPAVFPLAYSLMKPFLSEDTKRKTLVLNGNWMQQLLRDIDADQLPVHWGGTMTDPDGDPYCRTKLPMGGDVDPSFYLADLIDSGALTHVTVAMRSSLVLPYTVTTPGSLLTWQFMTEHKDIGFSVVRGQVGSRDKDQSKSAVDAEVVVPPARFHCSLAPEDGSVVCDTPGIYTVTFDNSYSWATKKKLSYQIEILPPAESDHLTELRWSESAGNITDDGSAGNHAKLAAAGNGHKIVY